MSNVTVKVHGTIDQNKVKLATVEFMKRVNNEKRQRIICRDDHRVLS